MGNPWQDEVSPRYLREDRIDLSMADPDASPSALRSFVVNVSYARTLPNHVVLPLILEVLGPSDASYQRRIFVRTPPQSFVVTPQEGGEHRIVLREAAHNRWWGKLAVTVAGDRIE
jgi:hypothetical protein